MSIPEVKMRFNKTLCFLFSGAAGTGKTFCSNVLLDIARGHSLYAEIASFAFGLKNIASAMGWDGKKDEKGRKLLQDIGAVGRAYNPNVWVTTTLHKLEELPGYPFDLIAIDDWRFPNEYETINTLFPLYRPVSIKIISESKTPLPAHLAMDVSETSLDEFKPDYYLDNSGSTESLRKELEKIFSIEALKNT